MGHYQLPTPTRSSAYAGKPAQRVLRSVEVDKHGTIAAILLQQSETAPCDLQIQQIGYFSY